MKNTYLEKDLEAAILKEIEAFILELGKGFAFLERQKRMIDITHRPTLHNRKPTKKMSLPSLI